MNQYVRTWLAIRFHWRTPSRRARKATRFNTRRRPAVIDGNGDVKVNSSPRRSIDTIFVVRVYPRFRVEYLRQR